MPSSETVTPPLTGAPSQGQRLLVRGLLTGRVARAGRGLRVSGRGLGPAGRGWGVAGRGLGPAGRGLGRAGGGLGLAGGGPWGTFCGVCAVARFVVRRRD